MVLLSALTNLHFLQIWWERYLHFINNDKKCSPVFNTCSSPPFLILYPLLFSNTLFSIFLPLTGSNHLVLFTDVFFHARPSPALGNVPTPTYTHLLIPTPPPRPFPHNPGPYHAGPEFTSRLPHYTQS